MNSEIDKLKKQRRDITKEIRLLENKIDNEEYYKKRKFYQVDIRVTIPIEEANEFESGLQVTAESIQNLRMNDFDWNPECGNSIEGRAERLDHRIVDMNIDEFKKLKNHYVHTYECGEEYYSQFDNIDKELEEVS